MVINFVAYKHTFGKQQSPSQSFFYFFRASQISKVKKEALVTRWEDLAQRCAGDYLRGHLPMNVLLNSSGFVGIGVT